MLLTSQVQDQSKPESPSSPAKCSVCSGEPLKVLPSSCKWTRLSGQKEVEEEEESTAVKGVGSHPAPGSYKLGDLVQSFCALVSPSMKQG